MARTSSGFLQILKALRMALFSSPANIVAMAELNLFRRSRFLRVMFIVDPAGIEPATSCMQNRCSPN